MTIVKRLQSWAAPLSRFHSHKVGFHRITEWFGLGGTFKGPVPILSCGLKCSGLCLNRAEVPSSVGCEQGKQSRSPGCQGVTVPSPGSASATELEMELTALWQLWWDGHQRRSWRGSRNLCHFPRLILKKWLHKMSQRRPDTWHSETTEVALCHPKGSLQHSQAFWNSVSVHNPHLCQPQSVPDWPLSQLLFSPRVKFLLGLGTDIDCSQERSEISEHKKTFPTVPRSSSSTFQWGASSRGQLKGNSTGNSPGVTTDTCLETQPVDRKESMKHKGLWTWDLLLQAQKHSIPFKPTKCGQLLSLRSKKTKLHTASRLYFHSRAKTSLLDRAQM